MSLLGDLRTIPQNTKTHKSTVHCGDILIWIFVMLFRNNMFTFIIRYLPSGEFPDQIAIEER